MIFFTKVCRVFNRLGIAFYKVLLPIYGNRYTVPLFPILGETMPYTFSWIRQWSQLGTLLATRFNGEAVGVDSYGNRYFTERKVAAGVRVRRWVLYAGDPEPSKIPPEWFGWLHSMADAPLSTLDRFAWQQPHEVNQTGTSSAHFPAGHTLSGKVRSRATGDYEAWRPVE